MFSKHSINTNIGIYFGLSHCQKGSESMVSKAFIFQARELATITYIIIFQTGVLLFQSSNCNSYLSVAAQKAKRRASSMPKQR